MVLLDRALHAALETGGGGSKVQKSRVAFCRSLAFAVICAGQYVLGMIQLAGSLDGGLLGRGRDATTAPGAVLESGGCGPISVVFNVDLGAPPSATPHF